MEFRILYRDEALVAIDKPAGFHVHPPEDTRHRISPMTNVLHVLSRQLGAYLYPVHRLDRATSGVLVFALRADSARSLGAAFRERRIRKHYVCAVRGWAPEAGRADSPLKPEPGAEYGEEDRVEAVTRFTRVSRIELPIPGDQHPTSRYSLLHVQPETGRMHQIRRHLAGLAHPLIGDSVYGHGLHNRIFRDQLGIQGLLLKAQALELDHPVSGAPLRIVSRWTGVWHRVFELFGVCAW